MGLDCKICEGEREIPAWYVNDTEKTVIFVTTSVHVPEKVITD
jgi:hypothetical protein